MKGYLRYVILMLPLCMIPMKAAEDTIFSDFLNRNPALHEVRELMRSCIELDLKKAQVAHNSEKERSLKKLLGDITDPCTMFRVALDLMMQGRTSFDLVTFDSNKKVSDNQPSEERKMLLLTILALAIPHIAKEPERTEQLISLADSVESGELSESEVMNLCILMVAVHKSAVADASFKIPMKAAEDTSIDDFLDRSMSLHEARKQIRSCIQLHLEKAQVDHNSEKERSLKKLLGDITDPCTMFRVALDLMMQGRTSFDLVTFDLNKKVSDNQPSGERKMLLLTILALAIRAHIAKEPERTEQLISLADSVESGELSESEVTNLLILMVAGHKCAVADAFTN